MDNLYSIKHSVLIVGLACCSFYLQAQSFYFGNDLSYVNEMEACGVVYKENEQAKDPYQIFADHNNNLVRLRLWHTPSWYDDLNSGERFSDLADVKRSIKRAKALNMEVLLDFHLSDTWADPGNQVVPAAWAGVVDDLPSLQDSLYNYIYSTLDNLLEEDLLPEMVQIGNETNRSILLSEEENNKGWVLDWERNTPLFNSGIKAVRDFEAQNNKAIKIVIHGADPGTCLWLFDQFKQHEVTDYDIIGVSYYWQWHNGTKLEAISDVVERLRAEHPGKEVMIVETGYIWTYEWNDNAGNILNEVHPNYQPPSPEIQRQWLIDLTKEVMDGGGIGVIYWEPAWVSSPCSTQWAKGSSYENTTFFDFNNNLHNNGGIGWMTYNYNLTTSQENLNYLQEAEIIPLDSGQTLLIKLPDNLDIEGNLGQLFNLQGQLIYQFSIKQKQFTVNLPEMTVGLYLFTVKNSQGKVLGTRKVVLE